MTAGGGDFFEQFIDDYFSECEEHLAQLRRVLLDVDAAQMPDPASLQQLARALHTLKGLSGMVGLAPAEDVAHAMEDAVRSLALADEHDAELVQLLFDGAASLERIIEARRTGASIPPSADYVASVRVELEHRNAPAAADPVDALARSVAVQRAATTTCRFEFVPSGDLAARGIGVEVIRQRLSGLGEITAVMPRVRASGGVSFEFSVTLRPGAQPDPRWQADGLHWVLDTVAGVAVVTGSPESRPLPASASAAAAAAPSAGSAAGLASNVVRVDLARLDDLMRMVGELVVSRARLGESLARVEDSGAAKDAAWDLLQETNERIERQLRSIREGVMRIRLVPVGEVFERMRFAMRDVARESGKSIRLEFSGHDTELDKLVVDRMLEPLLHLVRNSASHGIETPEQRRSAGKPAEGTISLRAQAAGDRILLEVEDDGAGIDPERVAKRAAAMGIGTAAGELQPDALLDVICMPGFSTREAADMSSGRGVGMAVVRTTIRALGGELFVHSEIGVGTRFTIELPLTLMITDALLMEVGGQAMAIPQVALREIVPYEDAAVTRFESNEVLSYRERVVPLVTLSRVFNFPSTPGARKHVLIVGSDAHLAGLVVEKLIGLREIVVHPLADPLTAVPGVAGATELPDGRVSLILDAGALVRRTRDAAGERRRLHKPFEQTAVQPSLRSSWS